METGQPFAFGGNVLNTGLIPNLPEGCCVEVMCVADRSGVTPTYAGPLPEQCAALTRTNVNVQLLTIEAALTHKKEHLYQAALLDPHTAAELTIDEIVSLCDEPSLPTATICRPSSSRTPYAKMPEPGSRGTRVLCVCVW